MFMTFLIWLYWIFSLDCLVIILSPISYRLGATASIRIRAALKWYGWTGVTGQLKIFRITRVSLLLLRSLIPEGPKATNQNGYNAVLHNPTSQPYMHVQISLVQACKVVVIRLEDNMSSHLAVKHSGLVWRHLLRLFFVFNKQLKTQNIQNYFYLYVISQPKNKKHLLQGIVKRTLSHLTYLGMILITWSLLCYPRQLQEMVAYWAADPLSCLNPILVSLTMAVDHLRMIVLKLLYLFKSVHFQKTEYCADEEG
jgi:hypothetical protein